MVLAEGRVNSKLNRGLAMQISNLLAACFHCDELYIHLLHPETGGYLPPPTITLHPSHITVAPGGCAVLECQAEGEGLIYNWNKDGRQFHQDRHGKLITDPVGPENLGEYCCEVVNDGGKIKSSPAKVVIREWN